MSLNPYAPVSSLPDSKLSAPIDLNRVRSLFANPARIVESNFLRREVAARMHERLALVRIAPQYVLDAGCGEGADLATLQKHFPEAAMLGLDAAPAMLAAAMQAQMAARSTMNRLLQQWLPAGIGKGKNPAASVLCGDFAQLPLRMDAVDLVWSNLALHWHPQPDRVFAEWRRVLRQDGLLMFSCFGPDTFKELRAAFDVADGAPHALPFVDMHDFGDMLVNAGFSTPVMDMETLTVTYGSVEKLMDDVRAWGGNPLDTRRRGLLGRRAWQRVVQVLEQSRQADGKIPLTFEVIYGHAFRPAPKTRASGESIVRFDWPKK
ncbi:Putative S-adenosyl-L-methionine-dependent methyltransferase [Herminiimonas arsenicoxydans]|uniref:Malonyl-[acyl-carrier protein] O-methyltransferase n=1 Tax=Herminiimonas arsenicoxydans TaxID=204773 RepID=A4G946_HERAR|nr:Putative S-adenosyl-L-methionine-dependent methyltransferase [Herminiimonas arsenicoxydans]